MKAESLKTRKPRKKKSYRNIFFSENEKEMKTSSKKYYLKTIENRKRRKAKAEIEAKKSVSA
jgi:hypothetical protein